MAIGLELVIKMSYDPKIGRELLIRIKETGHIRTLTINSHYRSPMDMTKPTKRNVIKKKASYKFRETIFTPTKDIECVEWWLTDTKTKSKQKHNVAAA